MIILLLLIGIKLEMPTLYWIIWAIALLWQICDS
jgi:hypothetical protein